MKYNTLLKLSTVISLLLQASSTWAAFNSGSTGADGAFNPTASQKIALPASGIFNYTSVNIPAGVIITYTSNASNTPVTILSQGDVVIAGAIDVSGSDGDSIDDALANNFAILTLGGPGGYAGGRGGLPPIGTALITAGGAGIGPGGGTSPTCNSGGVIGGGGSFGTPGTGNACTGQTSSVYGSVALLPLIGGSGGAGGTSNVLPGASGGGGGGAILIASSTSITVNGSILAKGGKGGTLNANGADGGGGSGGAIRLVATTLAGAGTLDATGGARGGGTNFGLGGYGRIRLEAETLSITSVNTPIASYAIPKAVTFANLPSLRITGVNGVTVPSQPNGVDDVVLPASITNPVTINVAATNVPVGEAVKVIFTPSLGKIINSTSGGLTGTDTSSSATASISLPQGPGTLLATVNFTVNASQSTAFLDYTNGEKVASVSVSTDINKSSHMRLITVSGKSFDITKQQFASLW